MDFVKDLQIDPEQLDVACIEQADLYFRYAEQSVEARANYEDLKFELEVLTAKLSGEIRTDPDRFGLSKPTEGAISAVLTCHPKYQEATKNLLAARRQSEMAQKQEGAFEQRKRMLENLIALHGQQYFAGPTMPRSLFDAWKQHKEGRDDRVKEKTKLRKRAE